MTSAIVVEIANEQSLVEVDEQRLREAVTMILRDAGVSSGVISLAVVDDATIARLHAEYLGDDGPTDVMSFPLESSQGHVEGEVVASAETAAVAAREYGWPPDHELLLYAIHGTLHLVGYRDEHPEEQAEMRRQEHRCLARLGLQVGPNHANADRRGGREGGRAP